MLSRPMINEYGNCSGDSGRGEWAGGKGALMALFRDLGFRRTPSYYTIHTTKKVSIKV